MKKPNKVVLLASFLFLLNSSVFANEDQTITARLDEIRTLKLESPTDAVLSIDHLLTSKELSTLEKGRIYLERGRVLSGELNEKDKALIDFYKALWYFRDIDAKTEEVKTLFLLGHTYNELYHHDKAIEYFKEVMNQGLNDWKSLLYAEYNIARSYRMRGDFDTAILIQNTLLEKFHKKSAVVDIADSHLELGLCYLGLQNWEEASLHYQKVDEFAKSSGSHLSKRFMAKVNLSLGFIDLKKRNYDRSEKYLKATVDEFNELEDYYHLIINYNNLGLLYHAKGEMEKAISYFKKSIELKQNNTNIIQVKDALNELISIYEKSKNLDIALSYSRQLNEIAVPFIELSQKLERLHDRYKAEKADYEIEKFKLQVALIKAQNRYIIIGIALIIVLIISIFYYIRFKKRQRLDDGLIERLKMKHQVLNYLSVKFKIDVGALEKLIKSGNL